MKMLLTGILGALTLLSGISVGQDATPATPSPATPQAQQNPAPTQSAPTSSPQAGSNPTGSTPTNATPATTSLKLAPGSIIPVQLTKNIDAKKIKTGDAVEAKVTQDMKAGNGDVIVPKDTKVVGRVTEAQARNEEQKESQIGIAFDRAVMKTGDINLPMSIQAIISPSYMTANNNSGGEGTGQSQSASAGTASGMPQSNGNARAGATGGSQSSVPAPSASAGSTAGPTEEKTGNGAHQPITGTTQGVLGIPDLTLSSANAAQGSVLTSEKNNVKLESGTLMLLRVGSPSAQQ